MSDFIEPIYPIFRTEKFNEDLTASILTDEKFKKEDRKRLSEYNKNRRGAGTVPVQYGFGQGCEEHQLGRLFPLYGIGMATMRWDIRNVIGQDYYWDVDIKNAHFVIACKFCEMYDIMHQVLDDYILNREERLTMVCPNNRNQAKLEFLKILYGGNIKLYREDIEEEEGNLTTEGIHYLKKLKGEMDLLSHKIWDNYPHYHHLKNGKEKIPISKKINPKASLMSIIFQTEERKMLMYIKWFMEQKGRYLGVFIHDGGYIEKLPGETEFPRELLIECSEGIKKHFGYNAELTQKAITHNFVKPDASLSEYEIMKVEWEKRNRLVGSKFWITTEDGYTLQENKRDAELRFAHLRVKVYDMESGKMKDRPFLEEYLKDTKRKVMERVDFIPNVAECGEKVYNLFTGLEGEKYTINTTQAERLELIKPILQHFNLITGNNTEFFLKWLSFIVQKPWNKTDTAILFRDEGDFLQEGGGTGKNLIFEWIGKEIIGEKYSQFVDNNEDLYDKFNSQFEGKIMVLVDEAEGKANHKNNDTLKARITRKTMSVNKKGVAQYTTKDVVNYLFCTNNRNPIPIKKGDRRWVVFDVLNSMRGNEEYFKRLVKVLNNDKVKEAFYQFLKYDVETFESSFDISNNAPITEAYKEIRFLNAQPHLKWMVARLKEGLLASGMMREIYFDYKDWFLKNKEGKEDSILTETAFSLMLQKSNTFFNDESLEEEIINRKMTNKGKKITWNIEKIVESLKKLYLLDASFIYEEATD